MEAGGGVPDEGRTSSAFSPTLGPWRKSIRLAEARTAQVCDIPMSSTWRFGVVVALLRYCAGHVLDHPRRGSREL